MDETYELRLRTRLQIKCTNKIESRHTADYQGKPECGTLPPDGQFPLRKTLAVIRCPQKCISKPRKDKNEKHVQERSYPNHRRITLIHCFR